jgi:phage I-like protein
MSVENTLSVVALGAISNGALQNDSLPTRIKVLDWGKNVTLDNPVYLDERSVKVFDSNQKKTGGKRVALDFDHCTVPDSSEYVKGQPKAIAAYGTPRIIPGDGLWLEDLEYTPLGEENARNYQDLSPAPIIDNEGVVIGLHSVALTPKGAIDGLTFYSANSLNDIMKKKSTMKMSSDEDIKNKAEKLEEHLEEDIKEQEKGIKKDKESLKDVEKMEKHEVKELKSPNDFKEELKKTSADENEHGLHCLCGKCSADMKQQIFTRLSLSTDPFGEINNKIKPMGAVMPKAYLTEPQNTKTFRTFMDEKIQKMATELNLPDASELEKRLKAWLAEWLGEKAVASPITGDPKPAQFSVDLTKLEERIKTLEADKAESVARFNAMEKQNIINEATKAGKVITFSAEEIAELSPKTLKGILEKIPSTVPMSAKTKVYSATEKTETKKTISDSAKAIQEQVDAVLANV